MKNKILNVLGFIIIIYGLSLGFTLLQAMLDVSNVIVILVIKPLPYFIAIYLYKGVRELKHDSNKAYSLQHEELSNKEKQISTLIKMDRVRQVIVDTKQEEIDELLNQIANSNSEIADLYEQQKEIDELKKELASVVTIEKAKRDLEDKFIKSVEEEVHPEKVKRALPFSQDNDNIGQQWICPDCNEPMTRQTDKTVFCDNIECTRKQWKKEKL